MSRNSEPEPRAAEIAVDLAAPRDLDVLVELALGFREQLAQDGPTDAEFRDAFVALLADPATEFLLARDAAGAAVGYAQIRFRRSAWTVGTTAEVEDLFVRPASRGAGGGRALLEAALARARSRGCRLAGLNTNERNTVALRLYESTGFAAARRHWGGARQLWLERAVEAGEAELELRPTRPGDLDFVLAHEAAAENAPFIGQWRRDEHLAAIGDPGREHWIVERGGVRLGYLIAYDLRAAGRGVYVKRVVAVEKSAGLGRAALAAFCGHAFADLAAPFVWLAVYPDNRRAQRSYLAAGFAYFAPDEAAWSALRAATGFSATSLLMRRERRGEPILRPPREEDWTAILAVAGRSVAMVPGPPPQDEWLRARRSFAGERRHFVATGEDPDVVHGYGAIEATGQGEYRLFVVAAPPDLEVAGDALWRRALVELRALGARRVWMREYAEDEPLLAFARGRGFAEVARCQLDGGLGGVVLARRLGAGAAGTPL